MKGTIPMKQVTSATITTIIDNYIDVLLPSTDLVKRAPLAKNGIRRPPLLAEHGFGLLIEAHWESSRYSLLMDFGASSIGVPHNLEVLEIDPSKIDSFVLSHGHHDHIGSVEQILVQVPNKPRSVVVHPDAFLSTRFHKFEDGRRVPIPCIKKGLIEKTGNEVMDGTGPVLLAEGRILVLGQIPRVTEFEKGMPSAYYEENGKVFKDYILDDKAVVLDVQDKGLVIATGCGHSGIINTVLHAKEMTGVNTIYCIIGGFHLTGHMDDSVIGKTLEAMKEFKPRLIVPCHCTGHKATQAFEKDFPSAFVLNASGTKFCL